MKKLVLVGLAASLVAAPLSAQEAGTWEQGLPEAALGAQQVPLVVPEPTPPTALEMPAALLIPRDTPVHLMVVKEVTTKTHQVGHRFPLRVDEPVVVDGQTVIALGSAAWGEIVSATSSGNLGKSGKLSARLLYVEAGDQRIAISGERAASGKSGTAETVMGVLGLGIFGLFAKGNNAKLKAGEMFTAFTSEDTALELQP